jgi:glycosyltransferase involved in cell wall biosynthesis
VTRVGIVFSCDEGWLGGINYFRNLLTAVYEFPERQIELVILTGTKTPTRHFEGFPLVKIVRSPLFDRHSLAWWLQKAWQRVLLTDLLFGKLIKQHKIDILSHSGWLGKHSSIPTIGWIPDFQHIHLPDFFSKKEISKRNKLFQDLCRFCTTILVSSFDAKADLDRFAPGCLGKSAVLQFVASLQKPETMPNLETLERRYNFSGKFFLLPNQFWKHKNHLVVIEALGLLVHENKQVLVLSTGKMEDYRHPDYYISLMRRAQELDVLNNFRPLGLVPGEDLNALMCYAAAMINPSFFEGWSTTVEEAKLLGKQIVLSDIPVHREQNPSLASYFPPDDASALAELLWKTWNNPEPEQMQKIEHAQCAIIERRREFAKKYQAIVLKTIEQFE